MSSWDVSNNLFRPILENVISTYFWYLLYTKQHVKFVWWAPFDFRFMPLDICLPQVSRCLRDAADLVFKSSPWLNEYGFEDLFLRSRKLWPRLAECSTNQLFKVISPIFWRFVEYLQQYINLDWYNATDCWHKGKWEWFRLFRTFGGLKSGALVTFQIHTANDSE